MDAEKNLEKLVERQRAYFAEGKTLSVDMRLQALERLEKALREGEEELCRALKADLGKSRIESYMCEVGLTLAELRYQIPHASGSVSCQKLYGTGALWGCAGYVALELSGTSDAGASDRRSRCRKLLCRKAFGLFSGDFSRHGETAAEYLSGGICSCRRRGKTGESGTACPEV